METTWKPHEAHGELSTKEKNELPDSVFAFPKQRKEPLTDASHVRNALARFDVLMGRARPACPPALTAVRTLGDQPDPTRRSGC